MTEHEKIAKTFLTLLSFSVLLASPIKRKRLNAKDSRFLLSLRRMKYSDIAGVDAKFERLMELKEKYL